MDRKSIKKETKIIKKEIPADDIYRMSFETDLCKEAKPGQFVMVYPPDGAKLLGRPVCIATADEEKLDIVFRVIGKGTKEIAACNAGDVLFIEGPLGNGYPMGEDTVRDKSLVLLGGGLGAPSLLFLAKKLAEKDSQYRAYKSITAILGYRDRSLNHFLAEDFEKLGVKTIIATDDGSEGIHGNVIDAAKSEGIKADIIYACGPMPMLSAVKKYAAENKAEAYISLEERMACGVGVCLGCVTKTVNKDLHSHVNNARVCTEGPVFNAIDVDI